MLAWNDLRHFLAVARHGSTIAAAKVLGVNQSTVHRRLCELERQLGRRLVERHPGGYRLTAVGEELRPLAERIEAAVQDLERRAASSEADLIGTVRVTCPETVGYRMMKTPLLDIFHERYPGLRIELLMVDRVLDLAKGEADIAFRTAPPQDDALVSRKLADVPWAMFASRSYVANHGQPERLEDIHKHAVIGFGGLIVDHPAARWLRSAAPDARVAAIYDHARAGARGEVGRWPGSSPGCRRRERTRSCPANGLRPCLHCTSIWFCTATCGGRTPRVRTLSDFVNGESKVFAA
jgi:DNA-binding transcriptional LysR family regulator